MDVRSLLLKRLAPHPVELADPTVNGKLFVRRMTMSQLQTYMDAVKSKASQEDQQRLLLSMLVCDADGNPVLSGPEDCDTLGDLWLPLFEAASNIAFGAELGNSTRAKSRRAG